MWELIDDWLGDKNVAEVGKYDFETVCMTAEDLTDKEWKSLRKLYSQRSKEWQRRFALVLKAVEQTYLDGESVHKKFGILEPDNSRAPM